MAAQDASVEGISAAFLLLLEFVGDASLKVPATLSLLQHEQLQALKAKLAAAPPAAAVPAAAAADCAWGRSEREPERPAHAAEQELELEQEEQEEQEELEQLEPEQQQEQQQQQQQQQQQEQQEQELKPEPRPDPVDPALHLCEISAIQDATGAWLAVAETVILLHPPLPLVGVTIWMKRGCSKMTVSPTVRRGTARM